MVGYSASDLDVESAVHHLNEDGYILVEGMLNRDEVEEIRGEADDLMARERENPWLPEDGPKHPSDVDYREWVAKSYPVSEAELDRMMRRMRHSRALNLDTPWPVPPKEMQKLFMHLPQLFDHDKSQRVMELPKKLKNCDRFISDPTLLPIVRGVLGNDCILSDISMTSIGENTGGEGGALHVDIPLGQMPEPLPIYPIALQNAWFIDDFTEENGATRLVPRSHLTRKKPVWNYEGHEDEIIVTGPAGSMAVWLSSTWHRSGPNYTDKPRRAILDFFCRSWIQPNSNYFLSTPPEIAERFSEDGRYLLGFSSRGLPRS